MPREPTLTVIAMSPSFAAVWPDLADELNVRLDQLDAPNGAPAGPTIVAAGGEEDRGLELLAALAGSGEHPRYLVGARTAHRFGIEALRCGASDYFALPDDMDLLRRTLVGQFETDRERRSGASVRPKLGIERILGTSPALQATLDRTRRILAHHDLTVLVGGETGTGKEMLARALHESGPRADGPFVAINCAAIPATLLESELFGHEPGAFTDARTARAGLFEEADGGTLFLDEVGQLPMELQGKLLRALEEKRIRRLGSSGDRAVDVRIVAATHVDLPAAVDGGQFRQDLYYRLNVVRLDLPPLRDRGDDVELLARRFAETLARRYDLPTPALSAELLETLRRHPWPGNVRELRHAIERALVLSPPGTLDPAELGLAGEPDAADGSATRTLRAISVAAARTAVTRHSGNKSAAARDLDISRARLLRLLDDAPSSET